MNISVSIGLGAFIAGFFTSNFVNDKEGVVILKESFDVDGDSVVLQLPGKDVNPVQQKVVPYKHELSKFNKQNLRTATKNNKKDFLTPLAQIIAKRRQIMMDGGE